MYHSVRRTHSKKLNELRSRVKMFDCCDSSMTSSSGTAYRIQYAVNFTHYTRD